MLNHIKDILKDSIRVKQSIVDNDDIINKVNDSIALIVKTFKAGNKVLFCGNGGSAADAQHLAAEFSGRFYKDRNPLPSEALHCNASYLTAVANDYGYEYVYSRLLKGIAKEGDVLVGLSTSGNSVNIVNAYEVAKELGMSIISFTGEGGGKMAALSDILIDVPSKDTPRIQECHITLGHIICQKVEEELF